MQNYSLTVLVKNDLDEKKRKDILDAITKQFDKLGKEDLWGVRSLAYPIKHQEKAFYAYYEFEAEAKKIPSLANSIKLNENILRHLLVKSK